MLDKVVLPDPAEISALLERLHGMQNNLEIEFECLIVQWNIIGRSSVMSSVSDASLMDLKTKFVKRVTQLWTAIHAFDDLIQIMSHTDIQLSPEEKSYVQTLQDSSAKIMKFVRSLS